MQFESHLRHVTSDVETALKDKVKILTNTVEEQNDKIEEYENRIKTINKKHEEELQQQRWKELQLTQQVCIMISLCKFNNN